DDAGPGDPAGVRPDRAAVVGALAERGSHVRARRPREARLLMRLACAVALAALLAAPCATRAQTGPQIIGQTVTLAGRPVSEPGVLALIQTRPGQPLVPLDVRESIAHLISLGRFDDVVVAREDVAGGIELHYELTPTRVIREIAFSGD